MYKTLNAFLCWIICSPILFADDWPCWRGPDRTGVSKETGLLKSWPKNGPKLLWKIAGLGIGYSTPSVAGGKVFIMGTKGEKEYIFALDMRDGKTLWATKVGEIGENTGPPYPGPRSTPTVDGDIVYTLGSDGDLVCLRVKDGKRIWHRHLVKEFAGNRGTWAYCESVLIDGDKLICTPGGPKATLAALHKKTGKTIWQTPVTRGGNQAAYSSVVKTKIGDQDIYVQFLGSGVIGVDAGTGKFLWRYTGTVGGISATTPIIHDGCVFTSSSGLGEAGGDGLIRLTLENGKPGFQEVYNGRDMMSFHGGVIRVGNYLYGANRMGLVCLEFSTGQKQWFARGIGSGSLTAADGHLYLRNTRGEVALIEINPKKYVEKGRLQQPERSRFRTFAHPVVSNQRLFLHDADLLFCYDLAKKPRD